MLDTGKVIGASKIARDISERIKVQRLLVQAEKIAASGKMAATVAHELNNPLTAILGYTQLLESEKLEPRIEEFVQKLRKQAQRTQRIVQNLLSFARQHKPQRRLPARLRRRPP